MTERVAETHISVVSQVPGLRCAVPISDRVAVPLNIDLRHGLGAHIKREVCIRRRRAVVRRLDSNDVTACGLRVCD